MKASFITSLLSIVVIFSSCKSKPSEKEIAKKLLLEYVCPDNAKVNSLKIIDTKQTQTFLGTPALEYTVSGEVEWAGGCDEAFGNLPAGYKEKFENKTVILAKTDEGWQ